MATFETRSKKGGVLEILGLEKFVTRLVDDRIAALKRAFGLGAKQAPAAKVVPAEPAPTAPAAKMVTRTSARPAAKTRKAPKAVKAAKASTDASADPLAGLLAAHPRKAELVRGGSQKDQLLRALIPLYLAKDSDVEVNSGAISRFWKEHGITFAAPNAAKALREHAGYAKSTNGGKRITPSGIKYVESALSKAA